MEEVRRQGIGNNLEMTMDREYYFATLKKIRENYKKFWKPRCDPYAIWEGSSGIFKKI